MDFFVLKLGSGEDSASESEFEFVEGRSGDGESRSMAVKLRLEEGGLLLFCPRPLPFLVGGEEKSTLRAGTFPAGWGGGTTPSPEVKRARSSAARKAMAAFPVGAGGGAAAWVVGVMDL